MKNARPLIMPAALLMELDRSEGWSSFSAFGVSSFGQESINVIGNWLEQVFVPVVMPLILDYLASPRFPLTTTNDLPRFTEVT